MKEPLLDKLRRWARMAWCWCTGHSVPRRWHDAAGWRGACQCCGKLITSARGGRRS